MSEEWKAAVAKAKALTETELDAAREEMRNRGLAIACYDAGAIADMMDVECTPDLEEWFETNHDVLEEAMCDRLREIVVAEAPLGDEDVES